VGAVVSSVPRVEDLASGDVDQILLRLRDPQTAKLVAAATGMSEQQARSTLADIQSRVEAARNDPAKAMAEARQGAQQLIDQAGKRVAGAAAAAQSYASGALWTTLVAMLLSLAAAIAGAMIGRARVAEWFDR
jgi:CHASE3 domain sensor protein